MLVNYSFNSVAEIDEEFKVSLDDLFLQVGKTFDQWRQEIESMPKEITYDIYLFFSQDRNSPVALAQINYIPEINQSSVHWLKNLFSSTSSDKNVLLATSSVDHAFLTHKKYQNDFYKSYQKIITKLKLSPRTKTITFRGIPPTELCMDFVEVESQISTHAYELDKFKYKNYENYLTQLERNISQNIKTQWKDLHRQEIYLNHYPKLEGFNSPTPLSMEQLSIGEMGGVLSLEKNNQILGEVFYYSPDMKTYYFQAHSLDQQIPLSSPIYIQYALMHFFEKSEFEIAIALQWHEDFFNYISLGFQNKMCRIFTC